MPSQDSRGSGATGETHTQTTEDTRETPRLKVRSFLPAETRESIVSMLMIHMRGVRSTARAHGLAEAEVEEILYSAMTRRLNRAVERAYQDGRRSMLPLAASQRRVA